tara:strand:+ start:1160 stop:1333 length:174 start_codon:yes stop_codon:yes gene_type:complete
MLVKATKKGFYGDVIRNEGDTFEIRSDDEFSNEWMSEVYIPKAPVPPSKPKQRVVES